MIAEHANSVPPVAYAPNPTGAYVGQDLDSAVLKKIGEEGARTVPGREHGGNCDVSLIVVTPVVLSRLSVNEYPLIMCYRSKTFPGNAVSTSTSDPALTKGTGALVVTSLFSSRVQICQLAIYISPRVMYELFHLSSSQRTTQLTVGWL